jgi:hypothetical protein
VADEDILEFYRVDQTARIRRILGTGAGILTLGALVTSIAFVADRSATVRSVASAFGVACCVTGALTAVIGMARALREDAYLAVRRDGILFHAFAPDTFVAWGDLQQVRFDAGRGLVILERRDGGQVVTERRFAGTTPEGLAKRLDELRRKAEWNLLGVPRTSISAK